MAKNVALTVSIVFLLLAASFGVGAAATAGVLIQAALPFALILIVALYFLGTRAGLFAWAAFTVGLLGSTYLQTGSPIEYAIFALYMVLAALGVFVSPYFLALAWLLHPVWDAVPRDLPGHLHDLPLACALFDTPIGLYLLWGAWQQRWQPVGEDTTKRGVMARAAKAAGTGLLILLVSAGIGAAADAGYVLWAAPVLSVVVMAAFRLVGHEGELVAWAMFTGWLGMSFAHSGGVLDALVFLLYAVVAALGVFTSPYFLAAAWLGFIPWSFAPHHLTQVYPDLPLASVFYCLPIGLYLLLSARKGRWVPAHRRATHPTRLVTRQAAAR